MHSEHILQRLEGQVELPPANEADRTRSNSIAAQRNKSIQSFLRLPYSDYYSHHWAKGPNNVIKEVTEFETFYKDDM